MEADAATAEEVVVEAVAASCHVSLMPVEASLGHGLLRTYQVVYFAVVGHPRAGVVISDGWEDVQRRRTLRIVMLHPTPYFILAKVLGVNLLRHKTFKYLKNSERF